ncbi:hypothetical protein [Rubritalea profundi]|uniref:Uncharacterized protein n=1 Tax=Rubritalea profundi TaxID=1658618 RepID=A0A2S7U4Q1_9BACT|nr:hypothetical protein [Rubritalea profundi]PQJ29988.1 hypothetical protein BSZ32_16875 [Rubritalea profundi]
MKLLILSFLSVGWCVSMIGCNFAESEAQISLPTSGVNPLDPVSFSRARTTEAIETADGAYRVGDYVEVAQPKTPMYSQYPSGRTRPQKHLSQGVVLNVLGLNGSYMHVQNEKGDEGYVSIMTVVPQGLLAADLPLSESDVAASDE